MIVRVLAVAAAACLLLPGTSLAQPFASTGTRAAGMGGAFVGVADDATAIYWNPAGLASGAYFSLVLDGGAGEITPNGSALGGDSSNFLLGLAMPALGLGYYRLHTRTVTPPPTLTLGDPASPPLLTAAPELRVDTLVTHHGGITLVQSLWEGVAVGTTLKLVRGVASSSFAPARTADEALDTEAADLLGRATNRFDLDVGIMASGGPLRIGFTLRNATEPSFTTAGLDGEIALERQARAGLSYAVTPGWIAAADVDLLKTEDAFGERRDVALGVEGRLTPRLLVRSGVSFNTVEAGDDTGRRAFSVGASFAARAAVFVDGHVTTGNDRAGTQWGIAARFVY